MAVAAVPQPNRPQREGVTVRDVLFLPSAAGAEVVAGRQGMNRPVRWVHISELLDIARLLTGGEFLLTTGMRFQDAAPDELRTYAASLAEAGVVAVGLELVQWIHEPPAALVEACEVHGLPLVVWRSEVRFRLIAEEVARRILDTGRRPAGFDEDELAEMLLAGPWAEPIARERLEAAGLDAGPWVVLGLIKAAGMERAGAAVALEQAVHHVRQAVPRAARGLAGTAVARLACSSRGEIAKVILTGPSPASLRSAWDALIPMLRRNGPYSSKGRSVPLRIGVSRPRDSLGGLNAALREAMAVLRFQSVRRPWPHVHFDQLQLGQFLLAIPEPALRRLVETELGALLKTPRNERPELLRTLLALLEHNFNVSATAKVLHLRRQSLYRRLARLEELLGPGFDQCDRRATLLLAIRASQLLGLYPEE
ncbi:PucR family transcriptional regulator [Thermaerobacter sp. PB12/4term]|uniref:PucR family transcriptional regulator n=1 Tax=Thermaerobacter sp. PB12/4term TaxID=2293838 RepID=UPI000E329D6D|nr:PucR family transcriptional regulator ligand-binding domain-containing protein [Thermaerobacter sp. PB12/4term]QIA27631.1 PucR family transcriptional regulator [Thermaerobacter sp. PB12/4term]